MAKQPGRTLLIKKSNGDSPETFSTVCGLRERSLEINNNMIDTTIPDCASPAGPLWSALDNGIKSLTASGSGIFTDTAPEVAMNTLAMAADTRDNFQIIVPDLGTFEGSFALETMTFTGEMEGAMSYEVSLRSNGEITFTAA